VSLQPLQDITKFNFIFEKYLSDYQFCCSVKSSRVVWTSFESGTYTCGRLTCNFDRHTPNGTIFCCIFQHYLLYTVYTFLLTQYLRFLCRIHLSYSIRHRSFYHAQITGLLAQSTQFLIFVMHIFTAHKLRVCFLLLLSVFIGNFRRQSAEKCHFPEPRVFYRIFLCNV
jgi:hypothetical protein